MSTAEAELRFLPKGMEGEIRRIVDECVQQFDRAKFLVHCQRVSLFRALVTYMNEHAHYPLLERHVLCITVHEAVQAIMNLDKAESEITLLVEPWKGE